MYILCNIFPSFARSPRLSAVFAECSVSLCVSVSKLLQWYRIRLFSHCPCPISQSVCCSYYPCPIVYFSFIFSTSTANFNTTTPIVTSTTLYTLEGIVMVYSTTLRIACGWMRPINRPTDKLTSRAAWTRLNAFVDMFLNWKDERQL